MIKKLQLRIVTTTMLTLFATMLAMIFVVNILTTTTNNTSADWSINYYHEYSLRLQSDPEFDPKIYKSSTGYNFNISNEDEDSWWSFIVVWYNADGSKKMIVLGSRYISDETAVELIERAENKNTKSGWVNSYRFGKFTEEDGTGFLVMNPAETERSRIDSMFQSTVTTAGICSVVMFVVMMLFLKQTTRPIKKTMEDQKRFLTDAGHELKTPITILLANNDIIEMNNGESELTKSNRSQLKRMSVLIQKMIDISKIDENIVKIQKEVFSLSEAVYDMAMNYNPLIESVGKTIDLKLDENVELDNDELQTRQLISILLDNAVKYCDDNGRIYVRLIKEKRPVLMIENSYSNIDKISLSKLFDRFYREDRVRTGGNGYGLGLSIARSISDSCGFDIKVKKSDEAKIMFTVKF